MAGSEEGAMKEPSDDAPVDAAATKDGEVGSDSEPETIWVEMPPEHVRWILSKKRESTPVPTLEDWGIHTQEDVDVKDADMEIRGTIASLQASQECLFEYQAWVHDAFDSNDGRVMVPEVVFARLDELMEAVDEFWPDA